MSAVTSVKGKAIDLLAARSKILLINNSKVVRVYHWATKFKYHFNSIGQKPFTLYLENQSDSSCFRGGKNQIKFCFVVKEYKIPFKNGHDKFHRLSPEGNGQVYYELICKILGTCSEKLIVPMGFRTKESSWPRNARTNGSSITLIQSLKHFIWPSGIIFFVAQQPKGEIFGHLWINATKLSACLHTRHSVGNLWLVTLENVVLRWIQCLHKVI